ncbi:glycerol kinase GlpK [Candidatus Pelagibacter sp.]|nr:glycerol kinase GlpK [Candidatus Pelagibacter sp.]
MNKNLKKIKPKVELVQKLILSIDQGTTSSRSILFTLKGKKIFSSQYEFKQLFPSPGWVEHNPEEIWKVTLKTIKEAIKKSKSLKAKIISIGITNQRETTILWDKITGKPIYNAIVWQDRRTQSICQNLKKRKLENLFRKKTGLFIDPYFSATKVKWIFDNIPKAKKIHKDKNLMFGTIDTFLIWRLTNKKNHLTDATNASRTMMFNINSNKWDDDILKKLNIPKSILPEVKNSADNFGKTSKKIIGEEIPINSVLGDQQAAAVGQACFDIGSVKITYGTGAFAIINTGNKKIFSKNKLLTTICYRLNNKNTYALEGSIFIAGAGIQWLRDKIKLINNANETEKISKSKISNDGIYIVPAFTGLGAPYWSPESKGIITGLTRNTDWRNLVRAMIESVAYQSYDLFESMRKDGSKPKIIKIDGGMVANNWFAQFLSNILNIKVLRPVIQETTALGVAFLAGYQLGEFKSLNEIKNKWKKDAMFVPKMDKKLRNNLLQGWQQAIRKTLA